MTRQQVDNVARHFGLSDWSDAFARLTIGDYKIVDREFGRLIRRKGPGEQCFKMLCTILGEETIRACLGPRDVATLENALAIANFKIT